MIGVEERELAVIGYLVDLVDVLDVLNKGVLLLGFIGSAGQRQEVAQGGDRVRRRDNGHCLPVELDRLRITLLCPTHPAQSGKCQVIIREHR